MRWAMPCMAALWCGKEEEIRSFGMYVLSDLAFFWTCKKEREQLQITCDVYCVFSVRPHLAFPCAVLSQMTHAVAVACKFCAGHFFFYIKATIGFIRLLWLLFLFLRVCQISTENFESCRCAHVGVFGREAKAKSKKGGFQNKSWNARAGLWRQATALMHGCVVLYLH